MKFGKARPIGIRGRRDTAAYLDKGILPMVIGGTIDKLDFVF